MDAYITQKPVILYHPTKWTVVETGIASGFQSLTRFSSFKEADEYLRNVEKHGKARAYFLKPQ